MYIYIHICVYMYIYICTREMCYSIFMHSICNLVVFYLWLSSCIAFCYTFTKDEKRYRDILLIRCVFDRIYTYIYVYIICIPCLFEYLFRISGNSLFCKLFSFFTY